jgi:hypothetical protein
MRVSRKLCGKETRMKILMGSLGKLGFLVKDVTRDGTNREWSIFPDEEALSGLLASAALPEHEIRGTLRRIRRDGRAVVSVDDRRAPAIRPAGR